MYNDRLKTIASLERQLKKDVIVICNNLKDDSELDYDMIDVVRRIMFNGPAHKNLAIILQTFGGDPYTSYFMIEMLREYYEKISIYIVGDCYSAGTMMAFQADEIYMGPQACLGPIDAQFYGTGYLRKDVNLWMPSLQSNINTLIQANEEGKISPFLKETFKKRMDILAYYFRTQNSENDLFKEAFLKHCDDPNKAEETWKYLLGEVGWHNVPLTYKKVLEKGIKVKKISEKLLLPITALVRDAEKEFGELKTISPLKDFFTANFTNANLTANVNIADIERAEEKHNDGDKKRRRKGKKGNTNNVSPIANHKKVLAIIETSCMGFVGYELYAIQRVNDKIMMVCLESGWDEENNGVVALKSEEDREKFNYVVEQLIVEKLTETGVDPAEITAEEYQELQKVVLTEQMEELVEASKEEFDYPLELLGINEKNTILVNYILDMYDEYKESENIYELIGQITKVKLKDVNMDTENLKDEEYDELIETIRDEEYKIFTNENEGLDELGSVEVLKLFKEYLLKKYELNI